jgi:hypothetical protein
MRGPVSPFKSALVHNRALVADSPSISSAVISPQVPAYAFLFTSLTLEKVMPSARSFV